MCFLRTCLLCVKSVGAVWPLFNIFYELFDILYYILFYIIFYRSEGGCPNGICYPWAWWEWGLEVWGNSSAAAAVAVVHPKSRVFGKIIFLRFVTHSRAMNFLAAAYESYGRGGSFIVSWIREKSICSWNIQKCASKNMGGIFGGEQKKRPCGNTARST